MAIIKPIGAIKTKAHLQRSVTYVMRSDKTMDGKLVSGVNLMCSTPEDVLEEFAITKKFFNKEGGRLAHHWEQSFKPGEVDPELAHKIGLEFAEEVFQDYQVVVATHVDKKHIHNHFILNTVSPYSGLKYHQPDNMINEYREANDQICQKYGLSVVPESEIKKHRTISFPETHPEQAHKKVVHNYIYEDFDAAFNRASSIDDFYRILQEGMGYEVKRGPNVAHTAIKPPGKDRFFRLYKFMKGYTEEDIMQRFSDRLEKGSPEDPSHYSNENEGVKSAAPGPMYGSYSTGKRYAGYSPKQAHTAEVRFFFYFYRRRNWTSLQGIFLQYLFILRRMEKGSYPQYPSFELRQELQRLNGYNQQTVLLVRNKINTAEQLSEYQASLTNQIRDCYREIGRLKNKLNRSRSVPLTDDERTDLKAQIEALRKKVGPLVKNQHLCKEIFERSQTVAASVVQERQAQQRRSDPYRENDPTVE